MALGELIFSVFRWFAVLVVVVSVASEPAPRLLVFMAYQVALACVELAIYGLKARSLTRATVGRSPRSEGMGAWTALRAELGFSLNLAFSALVWTMVTQSDRLTLSGILSLSDYAVFSLAVMLASTVLMISTPLGAVILPRLTRLFSSQTEQREQSGYIESTRAVTHIVMPVGLTLIFVSVPFLRTWTGDPELAVQAAPIARLYVFGNLILAISAFGFYLQYAIGRLRLHTIANIIMGLILVPLQIAMAMHFGAVGAALGWVTVNLLNITLWLPYVHHVYLPGVHRRWLLHGVLILPSSLVRSHGRWLKRRMYSAHCPTSARSPSSLGFRCWLVLRVGGSSGSRKAWMQYTGECPVYRSMLPLTCHPLATATLYACLHRRLPNSGSTGH